MLSIATLIFAIVGTTLSGIIITGVMVAQSWVGIVCCKIAKGLIEPKYERFIMKMADIVRLKSSAKT